MSRNEENSPSPPPRPRQVIERPGGMFNQNNTGLDRKHEVDISGDDLWGQVTQWKDRSNVWPVVWGGGMCGLMAGLSGAFIIHNVRKYLYLGHLGRFSSYLGIAFVPTVGLGMAHQLAITSDILEQRTMCPVCVQVRAAVLQVTIGIVYPILVAPFAVFPVMGRMEKSYRIPKLFEEPRAVFEYAKQLYKPWFRRVPYIAAAQVLISMGITYLEQEAYFNVILPEVRLRNVPIHKKSEDVNKLIR